MTDARQTIYEEIVSLIPGGKKLNGDSYMILCPFHSDSTPSCGINLTTDTDIPLGFYHCFGCGEKGHWNQFVSDTDFGLTSFKDWELGFKGNGTKRDDRKKRSASMSYKSDDEQLRDAIFTMQMIPWPKSMVWRGYGGDLIRKLGGKFYSDNLTDEMMLFFPITMNGRFRGGVRAYLEKQVGGTSYVTTKGAWVKDCGLLGYDYIKKIVRKYGYTSIVLVEGPRDAMRLIDNSIPALAILGIENFSQKKLLRILGISSKIDTIYVLPDNDRAGTQMFKKIKEVAGDLVQVKHLKLPKDKDDEGKLIKMDPDDAPLHIIKDVRRLLNSNRVGRAA